MQLEKRGERRAVYTQQPKGKLQILFGDQALEVRSVIDASQSGLQLEVGNKVKAGENVLVRYRSNDVDLKLNGSIMWSRAFVPATPVVSASESFLLGVRLASPSLLQTFW
jgi:hypothetical protein